MERLEERALHAKGAAGAKAIEQTECGMFSEEKVAQPVPHGGRLMGSKIRAEPGRVGPQRRGQSVSGAVIPGTFQETHRLSYLHLALLFPDVL